MLVRELWLARSELALPPRPASPPAGADASPGWTQQAVEAPRLLTHAKNETDVAFLPLAFGPFGAASLTSIEGLGLLLPNATGVATELGLALGFAGLLAVLPIYLLARGWIRGNQALLDRQVAEVTKLDEAFLERFAGTPA